MDAVEPPRTLTAGSQSDGLVLRSVWDPGAHMPELEIIVAEPRALFAASLLRKVHLGEAAPYAECDRVGIGGVVRIRARDRTLVYLLTEYSGHLDVYTGEWPD